jgi:hypothetical protein
VYRYRKHQYLTYVVIFFLSSRFALKYFIYFLFILLYYLQWDADEPVLEPEETDSPVVVMVEDALEDEVEDEVKRELPKHRRCAAHTVNLMATTDVSKVSF